MGDWNILAGVGDNFNTPITISNINDKDVDLDWSYSLIHYSALCARRTKHATFQTNC